MRIVIRKTQLPDGAKDHRPLLRPRLDVLQRELDGVEGRQRLQYIEAFIRERRTTRLLQCRNGLSDVSAEQTSSRLVWIGDELEGEEHGGRKAMERPPVHMAGNGLR